MTRLPRRSSRAVLGFDGFHRAYKRLFQNLPSDSPEHKAEKASLEILAAAYYHEVYVGCARGIPREDVGVARRY
jgi:hypothetical protein